MSGDAFDVERFSVFVEAGKGNAFDEFVAMIDVENDDAVAAVFEVITNARSRYIKESLLGRVEDEGANPFLDATEDGFRVALAGAIKELPERERLVMSLYYDDELNLKEIGAVLKVTESRVCQLHGQALVRLKARLVDWRDRAESRI